MCGICGLVGPGCGEALLRPMLARLAHRGPDHNALWLGNGAALGHSRLSIVDTSPRGNQPMVGEDGQMVLAANGEIYNSPELRRELRALGHTFAGNSDNEVLLHAYEQSGLDFLPRLNAMFALAIWDQARRRLLLARDRLGIKPLYFWRQGDRLAFASEIKALLACPWVPRAIDPLGLKQYLSFENTFGERTLHQGIEMLPPGQWLLLEGGEMRRGLYWQPSFRRGGTADFGQAVEAYRETVAGAVRRHMMSDVEVASYLSSGFDSSTVATLAADCADGPLATYCGAFDQGGWYDESDGARAVADRIGSRHTTVAISSRDFAAHFDDLMHSLDEPRMGPGSFSQYMVARQAAKRGKVILTGHGGDELFAGYPVFKFIKLRREMGGGPAGWPRLAGRVRLSEWPHLVFFAMQQRRPGGRGVFLPRLFSGREMAAGLRPGYAQALAPLDPARGLRDLVDRAADPHEALTTTYLRAYLPGLFVVEDKISMAHSLESRTPLCDNALVEMALGLPLDVKLHGLRLKAIPRAAMRGRLPEALYGLPKRGFPTPIAHWLRTDCRDFLRRRLLGPDSRLHRMFRPEFLSSFLARYMVPGRVHLGPLDLIPTHKVWMLLCLEGWLRQAEERLGVELNLA